MPRLTARQIETAKPASTGDTYIADGGGLFLKIASNGKKTFCFRYTFGRRRRLMSLGPFPEVSLARVREKHLDVRRQLEDGQDPLQRSHANAQALQNAPTVEELGREWLRRVVDVNFARPDEPRRMLEKDVFPRIGSYLAKAVTGRDVASLINGIVDRGSPVSANRTLLVVRKLFDYGVEQNHIDATPVTMTRKGAGGKETSRDRALAFDELGILLRACDSAGGKTSWQVRCMLQMLMLTGQRPGEVASMRWSQINEATTEWRIPAALTKSRREHVVHLSGQAATVLARCRSLSDSTDFVFGSELDATQSIRTRSLSRAVKRLVASKELKGVTPFTPHDLRRTVATRLADLGTAPHVIEKILNHQMEGVLAVYNRATYMPERKIAMDTWGHRIDILRLATSNNIVYLPKSA